MTSFSEDQMRRPLFEELTDDHERIDAWEEPLGFLVGGMANMKPQDLAEQYFDAASLLTNIIQNRDYEDYRLTNPTLFLYRHVIELLLKAAISPTAPKEHRLDILADKFVTSIKDEFDADVPDWIVTRIKELAKIDPGSTAFRYNENWDKTAKKDIPVDGEFHVNLRHLQSTMKALYTALTGAIDEIRGSYATLLISIVCGFNLGLAI